MTKDLFPVPYSPLSTVLKLFTDIGEHRQARKDAELDPELLLDIVADCSPVWYPQIANFVRSKTRAGDLALRQIEASWAQVGSIIGNQIGFDTNIYQLHPTQVSGAVESHITDPDEVVGSHILILELANQQYVDGVMPAEQLVLFATESASKLTQIQSCKFGTLRDERPPARGMICMLAPLLKWHLTIKKSVLLVSGNGSEDSHPALPLPKTENLANQIGEDILPLATAIVSGFNYADRGDDKYSDLVQTTVDELEPFLRLAARINDTDRHFQDEPTVVDSYFGLAEAYIGASRYQYEMNLIDRATLLARVEEYIEFAWHYLVANHEPNSLSSSDAVESILRQSSNLLSFLANDLGSGSNISQLFDEIAEGSTGEKIVIALFGSILNEYCRFPASPQTIDAS